MNAELVLPSDQVLLVAEAKMLDMEIRETITLLRKSLSSLSQLVNKMRDKSLWKVLVDPSTDKEFTSWEAYAKASSPFGHTKLFDLAAIGAMTHGPFAITQETIDAMGYNRAKEIAKLPPEERIKLVKSATQSTPEQFAIDLQQAKNKQLPPDKQKEATMLFARNYPLSVIAKFKQLEERFMALLGAGENEFVTNDFSMSKEAHFFDLMIDDFERNNVELFLTADKWLEKQKKKLSA